MHDYHKYQIKISMEEYLKMSKEGSPPDGVPNKVIEIPIFRNCEFDINKLCDNYDSFINKISIQEDACSFDKSLLKSDLYYYLSNSHASYLAPAFNYNCYIKLLIEDNINKMNHEDNNALKNVSYYYTILIQNLSPFSEKCPRMHLVATNVHNIHFLNISCNSSNCID